MSREEPRQEWGEEEKQKTTKVTSVERKRSHKSRVTRSNPPECTAFEKMEKEYNKMKKVEGSGFKKQAPQHRPSSRISENR